MLGIWDFERPVVVPRSRTVIGWETSIIASIRNGRRGAGAETEAKYVDIARERIQGAIDGTLQTRPMNKPKYDPRASGNKLTIPPWDKEEPKFEQLRLLQTTGDYLCEDS